MTATLTQFPKAKRSWTSDDANRYAKYCHDKATEMHKLGFPNIASNFDQASALLTVISIQCDEEGM